jgi:hypothetical protein
MEMIMEKLKLKPISVTFSCIWYKHTKNTICRGNQIKENEMVTDVAHTAKMRN